MPITMENKCGLILGVANERSIAWGISKVLADSGAEIAISYQNENLLKRVSPLAESVDAKICMLADVQNEDSLDILFEEIHNKWGKLDFLVHALAYSDKDELYISNDPCVFEMLFRGIYSFSVCSVFKTA